MTLPLVKLTYLDLIRGFVAVGRRMSITEAAADLCLSQSAVSRQIRSLEELIGAKLFERGHRSISFTPEGEKFYRIANKAVQQLLDGIESITGVETRNTVTISASIGVSGLWLLPRLSGFQRQHPEIDIRITADNRQVNLQADNVDLAIRYCFEDVKPTGSTRLFGETLAPVVHPSLGLGSLENIESFQDLVLLEFDDMKTPWLQWDNWFRCMHWADCKPSGILRFNQYDQVIQAAIEGQGVALARVELVQSMIIEGRLRVLETPGPGIITDYAYWLVRSVKHPRSEVDKVADWVIQESLS